MARYKPYERHKDSGVEWIGEIPEHWEVKKIGYLLDRNDGGTWGDDFDENGSIVLRSTEITLEGKWDISNPALRRIPIHEFLRCRLITGDLLMTKSSGSEQHIGKTALVDDCVSKMNCVFSNFMQRLRPGKNIHPDYLAHFFNNDIGRSQLFYLSSTTTGLKNLSASVIANAKVQLPPINEQQAIADFLDQKTSEIDGLVADKEKLVSLLQEYRQAIISEAVTKGLNPDVKMKDSGVEWIGEIPEHWEMCRLKRATELVIQKASNEDLDKPYIGLENIESWTGKYNTVEYFEDTSANLFFPGMVLFGKLRPYLAKSIKVDFWGRCSSELITLEPNKITSHFLHFLLLTEGFISEVNSSTYGVKMPRAGWEFIGNMSMSVPPESEQQAIANYLDQKTSEIDDLISGIQESIDQLKSYRQSLISEAVTGKIDVRGVI